MLIKIVLLSVLALLLVLPILLDKKLFAGSSADHYPKLLRLLHSTTSTMMTVMEWMLLIQLLVIR